MRAGSGELRIGMIGAGTMAAAHSIALANVAQLYPDLAMRPRLTAVADVNPTLATGLAERFGYERVETDWRSLVAAGDIDLVVVCLPPVFNREVVLAVAAAGKHVVCEKPLGASADDRGRDARGVPDGRRVPRPGSRLPLVAGRPRHRASSSATGELGTIRSLRAAFMLDYAADPEVPLLWRFRRDLAGGGIAIDTGYHLVDCARFIVGEIETVQAIATTFIADRPLPGADAVGNRGGTAAWRHGAEIRTGRRRGRGRRPGHLRRRGLRRPRDQPRRDRQARCRSSSRSTDRSARPSGTWSGRTSSACACPATRPPSGSGGSS